MNYDPGIVCDHCGEQIADTNLPTAVVTWIERTTDGTLTGFAITHEDCRWAWQDGNEAGLPLRSHHAPLASVGNEDGIVRFASMLLSSPLEHPGQVQHIIERIESVAHLLAPR
jgi:hypothetical protein